MITLQSLILFILGTFFGSFIAAWSYRSPRSIAISDGRSKCPKCKKEIYWYDNIPLLSFLLLNGRCRNCHKKISKRYPLIEFFTGVVFVAVGLNSSISSSINWLSLMDSKALIFLLIINVVLIAIFVVDLEHQIIPDEMIFLGLLVTLVSLLGVDYSNFFSNLLGGALGAMVLLSIHLVTLGKGMGLGDVKLALLIGAILGLPFTIYWLMISFIVGGLVALLLLVFRKSSVGDKIAFGPFLVVGFWVVMFFGNNLMLK